MPTYEYQCRSCKSVYELRQGFDAETTHKCEECGKGIAKRILSTPAVVFKGGGWYATDSREKASSSARSDPKGDATSDSKSESSSEASSSTLSTTDAKPAAKSESKSESKSEGKAAASSSSSESAAS